MKQAVILAGGRGSRLASRLNGKPKPLIDLCGVPLLERQIQVLKGHGFSKLMILVNFKADLIIDFCKSNKNWGLNIQYVDEGEPRGTAGAVLNAFDHLEDQFLVVYGDTMFDVDLHRLQTFHSAIPNTAVTLFLHPNDHPMDSDIVEADIDGTIRHIHPYPHPEEMWLPNLVNAALYFMNRDALSPWLGVGGVLDFGKDIFPSLLRLGYKLRGYRSFEYIKDVGTPSRIDKVSSDFLSGRIKRSKIGSRQKVVLIGRTVLVMPESCRTLDLSALQLKDGVADGIAQLNASEHRVCMFYTDSMPSNSVVRSPEQYLANCKIETLLGRHSAYLDRIECNLKSSGDVSSSDQLLDAKQGRLWHTSARTLQSVLVEMNADFQGSWLISNRVDDICQANRIGIRTILVEDTDMGSVDDYCSSTSFVAEDIKSAVSFTVKGSQLLKQCIAGILRKIESGQIVLIGGHSRSGKSTLAQGIRDALKRQGRVCHIIETDRWILSASNRGSGVVGRHDLESLRRLVKELAGRTCPLAVSLPRYIKSRRESIDNADMIQIEPSDVVIFEGVVALFFQSIVPNCIKIFVEVEEQIRKSRMIREYHLRGESAVVESIYEERFKDEWPWIEAFKQDAILFNALDEIDRKSLSNDY